MMQKTFIIGFFAVVALGIWLPDDRDWIGGLVFFAWVMLGIVLVLRMLLQGLRAVARGVGIIAPEAGSDGIEIIPPTPAADSPPARKARRKAKAKPSKDSNILELEEL